MATPSGPDALAEAVTKLVRNILERSHTLEVTDHALASASSGGLVPGPSSLLQLSNATFVARILALVSQEHFQLHDVAPDEWGRVVHQMESYAVRFLSAPEGFNLATAYATSSPASSERQSLVDALRGCYAYIPVEGTPLETEQECTDGRAALLWFLQFFVVIVVLSGNTELLQFVKALPQDDQVALSNSAKQFIATHSMKPRRVAPIGSRAADSATDSNPQPALADPSTSQGPTEFPLHFEPSRIVEGGGGSSFGVSVSTLTGSPRSPVSAAVSGGFSSAGPPTKYDSRLSSMAQEPETSAQPIPALHTRSLLIDDSAYRVTIAATQQQLRDSQAALSELQAAFGQQRDEHACLQAKYTSLLEEVESRDRASRLSADQEVSRAALAAKDERIRTLTAAVTDLTARVEAFKQATMMHEEILGVMKSKLRNAEESVRIKSDEKLEALQKLALTQDKLDMASKARDRLEEEVEDLRSQVALAKASLSRGLGGRAGYDTAPSQMNASFSSNGSLDRFAQLESEVEELRTQKEAAERHLQILQRQLASGGGGGAAVTRGDDRAVGDDTQKAIDVLKAKVRECEREKEALRAELFSAHASCDKMREQLASTTDEMVSVTGADTALRDLQERHRAEVDRGQALEQRVADLKSCLAKAQETSEKEHAVLTSSVILHGFQNLLHQQREVLRHPPAALTFSSPNLRSFLEHVASGGALQREAASSTASTAHKKSRSPARTGDRATAVGYTLRDSSCVEANTLVSPLALAGGSYLTRNRRYMELRLLEHVVLSEAAV